MRRPLEQLHCRDNNRKSNALFMFASRVHTGLSLSDYILLKKMPREADVPQARYRRGTEQKQQGTLKTFVV